MTAQLTPSPINPPAEQVYPLYNDTRFGGSISITTSNPGINIHVASQLPAFVSEDHQKFVQFVEEYYRWMETNGQVLHAARNLKRNRDIDLASEEYEEHILNEFLSIIPRYVVADKATILKCAKQFYTAKGTEKSFKFLFRILFNSASSMYYPKTDVLKVSDGKWIQNKTVRVVSVSGDIKNFRAKKIRGSLNNCTAFVERVYGVTFGGYEGYELILNRSSITGKFLPGETIVLDDGTGSAVISPIPESVQITRAGKDYSVGDKFSIENIGRGAVLRVAEIDAVGGITKLFIEEYGIGYNTKNPPTNFPLVDNKHPQYISGSTVEYPDTAQVNITLGSTTNYPGYFRNEDGQPSARKYIHDGDFYQQFSYVTYCEQSYNTYSDVLTRVLHPLGFKHFAGVLANSFASVRPKTTGTVPVTLVSQQPVGETINAGIKHHETLVSDEDDAVSLNKLGPSYQSIIRDKFSYKPFIQYDAEIEMVPQTESGYQPYYGPLYDQVTGELITTKLSSTPVSCFEYGKISYEQSKNVPAKDNFGPRHLEQAPIKKTNYSPDSFVILNQDRVAVSITSAQSVVVAEGDTTPKTISFKIDNDTHNHPQGRVLINGTQEVLQFVPLNSNPTQSTYTIDLDVAVESVVSSGPQAGSVVWTFSYTLFGTSHTKTLTIPYQEFRLALFVEDDLVRSYKSDNVGIKFLVSQT